MQQKTRLLVAAVLGVGLWSPALSASVVELSGPDLHLVAPSVGAGQPAELTSTDPSSGIATALVRAAAPVPAEELSSESPGGVGAESGFAAVSAEPDADDDGIPDSLDPDDDNDGTPDESDAFPNDPFESLDTDLDGIGNNADTDDDGDSYSDEAEILAGSDPLDSASIPVVDVPTLGPMGHGILLALLLGGAIRRLRRTQTLLRD